MVKPFARQLADYRRQSFSLRTLVEGFGQKTDGYNPDGDKAGGGIECGCVM